MFKRVCTHAAAPLLLAAAACVPYPGANRPSGTPGLTDPVPDCGAQVPPTPPEVTRGEVEGVVVVDYTVDVGGQVLDVRPVYPGYPPLLYRTVRDWLTSCRHRPGSEAGEVARVRMRAIFGFNQPYAEEPAAVAIHWGSDAWKTLVDPAFESCAPAEPPFLEEVDDTKLDLVVQSNGRAGELRVLGGAEFPADILRAIAVWTRTCRFRPATTDTGVPVAVRAPLPLLFGNLFGERAPDSAAVIALGEGLSRPLPDSRCGKPRPTRKIREEAILGVVLVEYVVHTNGRVGEVRLRNPAPSALFHAVRDWLLNCPFSVSRSESGEAVAVRIIQPFTFKPGR